MSFRLPPYPYDRLGGLAKLADDERPLAISSGDGLVELPKRLSCAGIHRTDDVVARSKP